MCQLTVRMSVRITARRWLAGYELAGGCRHDFLRKAENLAFVAKAVHAANLGKAVLDVEPWSLKAVGLEDTPLAALVRTDLERCLEQLRADTTTAMLRRHHQHRDIKQSPVRHARDGADAFAFARCRFECTGRVPE